MCIPVFMRVRAQVCTCEPPWGEISITYRAQPSNWPANQHSSDRGYTQLAVRGVSLCVMSWSGRAQFNYYSLGVCIWGCVPSTVEEVHGLRWQAGTVRQWPGLKVMWLAIMMLFGREKLSSSWYCAASEGLQSPIRFPLCTRSSLMTQY